EIYGVGGGGGRAGIGIVSYNLVCPGVGEAGLFQCFLIRPASEASCFGKTHRPAAFLAEIYFAFSFAIACFIDDVGVKSIALPAAVDFITVCRQVRIAWIKLRDHVYLPRIKHCLLHFVECKHAFRREIVVASEINHNSPRRLPIFLSHEATSNGSGTENSQNLGSENARSWEG